MSSWWIKLDCWCLNSSNYTKNSINKMTLILKLCTIKWKEFSPMGSSLEFYTKISLKNKAVFICSETILFLIRVIILGLFRRTLILAFISKHRINKVWLWDGWLMILQKYLVNLLITGILWISLLKTSLQKHNLAIGNWSIMRQPIIIFSNPHYLNEWKFSIYSSY